VGIQILRAITGATVIALDVDEEKQKLAREVGAHRALHSDEKSVAAIRELTGGEGAQVVFDFVGAPPTLEIARQSVAMGGRIEIVGIGGGTLTAGFFATPYGATVRAPYWGTRAELIEVLDLARHGAIHVETERFTLEEAPEAYRRLHEGTIRGRAVVVP
jgi:propanol-preferring alcohol dehydrogenase